MSIHHGSAGSDDGFAIWDVWSQGSGKYKPGETWDFWCRMDSARPGARTLGSLFHEAKAAGWLPAIPDVSGVMDAVPNSTAIDGRVFRSETDPAVMAAWPRKRWAIEGVALLGQLSALVAPGGIGKSTLAIQQAAALATGRGDIISRKIPAPAKSLIINFEDTDIENKQRLYAACLANNLDHATVAESVYFMAMSEEALLLAVHDAKAGITAAPLAADLIKFIKRENIRFVSVDPLSQTHGLDENSNSEMAGVMGVFRRVAAAADCALQIVHHTTKPPQGKTDGYAGNAFAARGAGVIVTAVRAATTLYNLSAKEAENLGVPERDRRHVLQWHDAKANVHETSGATYFRRQSVLMPNGDTAPALTSFVPCGKATRVSVTPDDHERIRNCISNLLANDGWRNHNCSPSHGKGLRMTASREMAIDPGKVDHVIDAMEKAGEIKKAPSGRNSKPGEGTLRWRLVE